MISKPSSGKVLYLVVIILGVLEPSLSKKSIKVACPVDKEPGCVECECETKSGYSICKPIEQCPPIVTKVAAAVRGKKDGECQFGSKFTAECISCECTGKEDRCAICSALPIRRPQQSKEVNDKLPFVNDARITMYEVEGWTPSKD